VSFLLYAEPVRGTISRIDINGQGAEATLDPGSPLLIKGEYAAQNPKSDRTDTVQIILFLGDKFFKCVYNDVPAEEPNLTKGTFVCRCTAPTEKGEYALSVGWAYNWNWPEQAYKYLLATPERIEKIGSITVGAPAPVSPIAAALIAIPPIATIIGMATIRKK